MVFSDCNLMQTIKEMVDDDTNAENQDYKSESSDDDPDHDFDEHVSSCDMGGCYNVVCIHSLMV